MGCTRAEFGRTLEGGFAMHNGDCLVTRKASGQWQVAIPSLDLTVAIATHAEPPRRLGAMTLPVLDVQLTFMPDDEKSRQLFLEHFWRFFHKGGG